MNNISRVVQVCREMKKPCEIGKQTTKNIQELHNAGCKIQLNQERTKPRNITKEYKNKLERKMKA